MKVDTTKMLITDFEVPKSELDQIYCRMVELTTGSQPQITDAIAYFRPMFEEWCTKCGLNDNQSLLVMSTVFPIRVLMSLINAGFSIK